MSSELTLLLLVFYVAAVMSTSLRRELPGAVRQPSANPSTPCSTVSDPGAVVDSIARPVMEAYLRVDLFVLFILLTTLRCAQLLHRHRGRIPMSAVEHEEQEQTARAGRCGPRRVVAEPVSAIRAELAARRGIQAAPPEPSAASTSRTD